MSDGFIKLSPYRGLSDRQQHLLGLRSVYLQTQYLGTRSDGTELAAWDDKLYVGADRRQHLRPSAKRRPKVLIGLASEVINRLVDKLVGEGRMPRIAIEGDDASGTVEAACWDGGLDLEMSLDGPAVDLATLGACAMGFDLVDGRVSPWYFEPEWCDVVLVSQASSPRALDFASELLDSDVDFGSAIVATDTGAEFVVPPGAEPSDVLFMRHQYPHDGSSTRSVTWSRTDYLVGRTIRYQDVEIAASRTAEVEWVVAEVDAHGWSFVPVAWVRMRGARPQDTEGPSLLTPSVISQSEDADYLESLASDGVALNLGPLLYTIDARPRNFRPELDESMSGVEIPTDPNATLELESSGQSAGKAGLLEPNGAGAESARERMTQLVDGVGRSSGMREYDQSKASGTLSGTALHRMNATPDARVKAYRAVIGRLISSLVRKVGAALGRSVTVTLEWPSLYPPTLEDANQAAQAAVMMLSAGMPQAFVVGWLANQLEAEDAEKVVSDAQRDEAQRLRDAMDSLDNRGGGTPGA